MFGVHQPFLFYTMSQSVNEIRSTTPNLWLWTGQIQFAYKQKVIFSYLGSNRRDVWRTSTTYLKLHSKDLFKSGLQIQRSRSGRKKTTPIND